MKRIPAIEDFYEKYDDMLVSSRKTLFIRKTAFHKKAKENLFYGGRPIPVLFYPYLLSEEETNRIAQTSERMLAVFERAIKIVFDDEELRKEFRWDEKLWEIISLGRRPKNILPFARFDSYYNPNDENALPRFLEMNTDGSAGMHYMDSLNAWLSEFSLFPENIGYRFECGELKKQVLATLLAEWREFSSCADNPAIAICDWKGVKTESEFFAFKKFFAENNISAVVCDPREFSYDGKNLYAPCAPRREGQKIDIIYRRFLAHELAERAEDAKPLIRAVGDGNVCVAGPLMSHIGFDKSLFALISSGSFDEFLSEDEKVFCKKVIPWTRFFKNNEAEFQGERISLAQYAEKHKDKFVIKPASAYGGAGVTVGFLVNASEWQCAIDRALAGHYIIQERVAAPKAEFADITEECFCKREYAVHLGEYVFGKKFAGFFARISRKPIINPRTREKTVPCGTLKSKEKQK